MNQFSVSDEMKTRYILNRQKELDLLTDSLNIRDFSFIAGKAHNIKGTAESFGFPELGIIGQHLEAAALNSEESVVREQIQKILEWVESHLQK